MSGVRISENFVPNSEAPAEQARFIAAVNEGLADVQAGRTHTHAEVVERMSKRFRRK